MKLNRSIILSLSLCLLASAGAQAGEYSEDLQYFKNALKSARFSERDLETFQDPTKGPSEYRLNEKRAPWAGNYFPMDKGGIANRWQDPLKQLLDVKQVFTKEDFLKMSPEQINALSPAEKYDLMMGDYEFSATKHELHNRGPLRLEKPENWEGFCNGVRAAGILLPEPTRVTSVTNPDGIVISFNIADLKALAGTSYFYVEKYSQLGAPSRETKAQNQPNAAVFDLALRYFLAEKKKAFIVDSHLGSEIWNESVVGYRRQVSEVELTADEKEARPWAQKKIQVNLMIETLGEIEIKDSDKTTKKEVASGQKSDAIRSNYVLFVDANGKALDGAWQNSDKERGIDFAWFSGGRGTDAHHTDGENGNPWLDFSKVRELFIKSSTPMTCKNVFRL